MLRLYSQELLSAWPSIFCFTATPGATLSTFDILTRLGWGSGQKIFAILAIINAMQSFTTFVVDAGFRDGKLNLWLSFNLPQRKDLLGRSGPVAQRSYNHSLRERSSMVC